MSIPVVRSNRAQNLATRSLLCRLLRLFRPYWHLSLQALLAIFALGLIEVASPKILELLIDQAIPQKDRILLALLALLLFALPTLSGIVGIAKSYLDVALSQQVMHDLRVRIYARLQQVSLRFYTRQRTGEILSRLTNDINGVEDVVKNTLSQTLSNTITIILVLILMFNMNVPLTFLCLILVPLFSSRSACPL